MLTREDLKQIELVLDKRLKPINNKLVEHSRKLDALIADVVSLQERTKILTDIHENTKDTRKKVEELEGRVEVLETSIKF